MSTFLEDDTSEQVVGNAPLIANSLWVERHRPVKLDDYVASPDFKAKVKKWIDTNDVPHLLFYGGPGTGKTTLAKLIAKSIKCDLLYVNASDERKIDDIRYKVKSFASSLGFQDRKIIILDEADYITPDAQAALRNLMEAFSNNSRFILTCNYHERIIDAIVSRCQSFPIYPPTKKDVAATLVNILKQEGIKYDKEGVVALVQAHYPDIRAVIGTAQSSVVDGALVVSQAEILEGDIKTKVVEMLKNPNKREAFNAVRQLIADNSIREFSDFYTYLYEKVDEYAPNIVGATILALADSQFQDSQVVDKEICFMSAIYKILHLK